MAPIHDYIDPANHKIRTYIVYPRSYLYPIPILVPQALLADIAKTALLSSHGRRRNAHLDIMQTFDSTVSFTLRS